MTLLSEAVAKIDKADLILLAHVETIRDQMQPATASAVASLIRGAPVMEIAFRLRELHRLGCLEVNHDVPTWQLSELGVEVLRQELIGWSPSEREDRRREREMLARINQLR